MKLANSFLITSLLISSLFAASCSQSKNVNSSNNSANNDGNVSQTNQPPKLTVVKINAQGKEPLSVTGELKFGRWMTEKSKDNNFEFIQQIYCLSNAPITNDQYVITPNGIFIKICFAVNESKQWQNESPLSLGTYYIANDERSDMGRIASVSVETGKDGRRLNANIDPSSTYGNIVIENSSEQFISGKFAVSDRNFSVNGSFATELR